MKPFTNISISIIGLLFTSSCTNSGTNELPRLNISNLEHVGSIDKRYQSFNIEMCEVVGADFWIPYHFLDSTKVVGEGFSALKRKIPPVNLYEQKLRTLAAALGPVYVRVSGLWANTTYFQDNDKPKLEIVPDGYTNVLTRKEWKGVVDFCKAVNGKLVTSFAIGDGIRDSVGNWTPVQAGPFINYTKALGGEIVAAEMFNEPSHASHGGAPIGYNADRFAKDFEAFRGFMGKASPETIIMGPGSTGEGGILGGVTKMSTDKLLTANPKPEFEILTYHYYGSVSKRCFGELTPENALTDEWLNKTERALDFYEEMRNIYLPDAPIWLTETGEAACGGNPWAATYIDCFRYLMQMGKLARRNVQVVMHNTLCASEYAFLENDTHDPRPNYWGALLWHKLMGTEVYNISLPIEGLGVYAHNLNGSDKGIAVLIVNPKETEFTINIPAKAEQYLLTADELLTKTVKLNGKALKLKADDTLPEIKGKKIKAGNLKIPAHSILFLSFDNI